jgi:hypothetical protein
MITKNKIKGNNTKNHENCLYPALQIESKTNVQNATYKNLNMKIKAVFGTGHSNDPTQYTFSLPPF